MKIRKLIICITLTFLFALVITPVKGLEPTTSNKGDIYNPITDRVEDVVTIEEHSYLPNELYKEGDVEVRKIVSKTNVLGEYKIEFQIRGKKTKETTIIRNNVYAVIVFDKSTSMNNSTNKWNNAVLGAKTFARTLLEKIPKAKIALIEFSGSYDDEGCKREWLYDEKKWGYTCSDLYNDATIVRSLENSNLDNTNFGMASGGTNLEEGLRKAKNILDEIKDDKAIKYVIVIGDGEPTFYTNDDGITVGPGNKMNDKTKNAAYEMANSIKNSNTEIYAIGYAVGEDSDAKEVLKTVSSTTKEKNYYYSADTETVAKAFSDVSSSIDIYENAGTNVTLVDNLGSSFNLKSGSNTLSVETITEDYKKMGEFYITIDGDVNTGWYITNNGFTLTYTDTEKNIKTITSNTNPKVYWIQNEYSYRIEYYYDNIIDNDKTINAKDIVNKEIDVTEQMITDNLKIGYEYKKTIKKPISNNTSNVIKVYYEKKSYHYTIEHYLEDDDGYILKEKVDNNVIKYHEEAVYQENSYHGYKYNSSKTLFNKSDLIVEDNELIIKLYYDKETYSYIVEHYIEEDDGFILQSNDSKKYTSKYLDKAEYTNNNYDNYNFDNNMTTPKDLTILDNTMVIKLYYLKKETKVTVNYVIKSIDNGKYFSLKKIDGKNSLIDKIVLNDKIGNEFVINGQAIDNYEFVGIYEGNLLTNNSGKIIDMKNTEYKGRYLENDLEFTYVYQQLKGDGPPVTLLENELPKWIIFIIFGIFGGLIIIWIKKTLFIEKFK